MVESLWATRRWWGLGNCSFVKVLQKSGSILVVVLTDKLKGHTLKVWSSYSVSDLYPFTHNLLSQYSSAFVSNLTWLYRLIPLIHHPLQTYIHTYVIVKIKKKNFQCPTLHIYLCIQQYTWSCPIIFIKENNLYLNKVNALLHTYEYIHNEPAIYFQSVPE